MRWLVVVALAACGAPHATPAEKPIARHAAPDAPPRPLVLEAGTTYEFHTTIAARLTTFELVVFGDEAATIVERDDGREAHRYIGSRRGGAGGAIELELAADDMQALHLHCVPRVVAISPTFATLACGAWTPTERPPLAVLACGGAGEPDDESLDDDDDRLVFAPAPGVERIVARNEGCPRSSGLRRMATMH